MYDRLKAIEYAKKYAFDYNENYYDFKSLGGDCTNFISQCLFAGGINMDYSQNGWFYSSINSRSASWTSVEYLWDYCVQNKNIKFKECNIKELEIGDIIQFFAPALNRFYHTVIITKIIEPISVKNILVSSHDNNAYNKSLLEYNINFNYLRFGKILN